MVNGVPLMGGVIGIGHDYSIIYPSTKETNRKMEKLVKKYGTALSPEQAQDAVKREIGAKFETCLEHAGVFKLTPDGLAAFDRFLAALGCEKL